MNTQTIIRNKTLKIDKEPVVIFPLRKWQEIEEYFENLEDTLRFNLAYKETRSQKTISLNQLKKKYCLK